MEGEEVLGVLEQVARAVRRALDSLENWGPAGTAKDGQYHSDLVADRVAVELLDEAGFGVLSEESGERCPGREVLVVVDPVDGSTNAARGIPWFATSLCALDRSGPLAAVVANQADGTRYTALRGGGARRDGEPISPSGVVEPGRAMVGLSGFPSRRLGWRQARMLGAAALDLCLVADGTLDAYLDCGPDAHGPWDYLGGMLVCAEAGAPVVDALGRDLVVRAHGARRTPCAAATPDLLERLVAERNRARDEN